MCSYVGQSDIESPTSFQESLKTKNKKPKTPAKNAEITELFFDWAIFKFHTLYWLNNFLINFFSLPDAFLDVLMGQGRRPLHLLLLLCRLADSRHGSDFRKQAGSNFVSLFIFLYAKIWSICFAAKILIHIINLMY